MDMTRLRLITTSLAGACATALAAGALAGPALADGPCGDNETAASACAVNSATTPSYAGSIVSEDDTDYYVFHAAAGTQLTISLTDTEDPSCSSDDTATECGDVTFSVVDASGDAVLDDTDDLSQPQDGAAVPLTDSTTLQSAGTYEIVVSGDQGSDADGDATDTPYTLQVSATAPVVWPAPSTATTTTPSTTTGCTVPAIVAGSALRAVRRALRAGGCDAGAIHLRRDRHVRAGRAVQLSSPAGTQLPAGTPVSITVSTGRHRAPRTRVGARRPPHGEVRAA